MIIMGKIKKLELTPKQYAELENGFRNGGSHCFRMRCRAVLLKGKGLSSVKAGEQTEMSFVSTDRAVSKAKEVWQQATGKRASDITFKRFLSALAQDISV